MCKDVFIFSISQMQKKLFKFEKFFGDNIILCGCCVLLIGRYVYSVERNVK